MMKYKLTPEDKKQILDMIEQVDKILAMFKEGRDEAKTPELKKRWTERIDAMLDERMCLMNVHDGKEIKV